MDKEILKYQFEVTIKHNDHSFQTKVWMTQDEFMKVVHDVSKHPDII